MLERLETLGRKEKKTKLLLHALSVVSLEIPANPNFAEDAKQGKRDLLTQFLIRGLPPSGNGAN